LRSNSPTTTASITPRRRSAVAKLSISGNTRIVRADSTWRATPLIVSTSGEPEAVVDRNPFPKSLAEQKQIVAKLDSLREETRRLESLYQRKLTALDDLKKSLPHRAFSEQL
jgi:type I restriction enzyme S subunit